MTEKGELLELYKVMVGTVTANEQRRQQSTAVYLSLAAASIAAAGAVKNIDLIYFAIPAFVISLIWFASIRYFRRLAKAKFAVIEKLEKNFEIQPFKLEWKFYKSYAKRETWLPSWIRVRFGLTHLEMAVPATLGIASALYLFWRILDLVIKYKTA